MTSIKDTDNTKKPKHATVDDDVNDLAIERYRRSVEFETSDIAAQFLG
jgi:hypothetical protein